MAAQHARLPTSEWPATPSRLFFIYDNPQASTAFSYHASPVAVKPSFATCVVTCASPCPDGAIPTQTITHISGSSWAGEYTVDGAATSWGCNLGQGSDDVLPDQYGECFYTTAAKRGDKIGDAGGATSTPINKCFAMRRSAVVLITADQDKWNSLEPPYQAPVDPKELWRTRELAVKSACGTQLTTSSAVTKTRGGSSPASATAAPSTGDSAQTSQPSETRSTTTSSTADAPPNTSAHVSVSRALLLATALLGVVASL
ncbi:DUF300 domain protein [Purpureocillium lavendulum]|uniref:DUF300 domain protein n=1 Tax=Purpureocillium lavendulum TaxID=1247861 RepID=A0AB34FZ68_9HYPO|nr:DUF300 domain protein [Purpureocillium lavendulum]